MESNQFKTEDIPQEVLSFESAKARKNTLFPWTNQKSINPKKVVKTEGCFIYFEDGMRLLDFSSQLVNVNIGHGKVKISEAVFEQMQNFSFVSPQFTHTIKEEFGERLAAITPGNLNKFFYTLSGAEANENAVKMAMSITGRYKIMAFEQAYHGASFATLSFGCDPRRLSFEQNMLPGTIQVKNPHFYRCPWNSVSKQECSDLALHHIREKIDEHSNEIAAFVLEGYSGTSGCLEYPDGFWDQLVRLCRSKGILVICDEVMSGFGRTGTWFGCQHYNELPDMITMAKGITGGYLPLGCVAIDEKLASYFECNPLVSGLTNAAHPICLAAANAALSVYHSENLIFNVNKIGQYLKDKLIEFQELHPAIGDIRIKGLLGVIELVKNRIDKTPMAPYNATPREMEIMNMVSEVLKNEGIFTLVRWNYVFIAPPLDISIDELNFALKGLDKAISKADEYIY